MKKIIVKETDRFKSKLHKNKTISQYLIYLNIGSVPTGGWVELGEEAKKIRVNELILLHFMENNNEINKEDVIEEYSLKELIN
jgi:hypothetical protein